MNLCSKIAEGLAAWLSFSSLGKAAAEQAATAIRHAITFSSIASLAVCERR
jgi:hypothetical protein